MSTYVYLFYVLLECPDIPAGLLFFFPVQRKTLYQSALQNTSRLVLPARLKFMNLVALSDCQQNQLIVSTFFSAYCFINYE